MEDEKEYKFSISEEASKQIKLQLQKRDNPNCYLRLGVKGAGCSGYSYVLQFEDSLPKERDYIFTEYDIKVVIDKKSILYLNGSMLDWEKSLLNQGFKFINPNEKSRCGCGISFTI